MREKKMFSFFIVLLMFCNLLTGISLFHTVSGADFPTGPGTRLLHTEGAYLVDDQGTQIHLHGVCKNDFIDNPDGAFHGPGRTWEATVRYNLEMIKNWGCNFLALAVECVQYLNNVDGVRDNYKNLVRWAQEYSIYVGIGLFGYNNSGWGTDVFAGPWAGNAAAMAIIADKTGFMDFWNNVSSDFKDAPNVIYGVVAEVDYKMGWPQFNEYYQTVVQAVQHLRAMGDNHVFFYHEGSCMAPVFFTTSNASEGEIVHPLHNETTNIVYSAHAYRYHGTFGNNPDNFTGLGGGIQLQEGVYSLDADTPSGNGLETALKFHGYYKIMDTYKVPILMWEGGAWIGSATANVTQDYRNRELTCYANLLRLFNVLNISYAAFWWKGYPFTSRGWQLINHDTAHDDAIKPTVWGQVLIDAIHSSPFETEPTPTASPSPPAGGLATEIYIGTGVVVVTCLIVIALFLRRREKTRTFQFGNVSEN